MSGYAKKPARGNLVIMANRSTLALPRQWGVFYDPNVRPGPSPRLLNALILSFPISSALWAAIIYAASKLIH